jgi:hypothetical protein
MATTGSVVKVVPDAPAAGSAVNSRKLGSGVMLKTSLVTLRGPVVVAVNVKLFPKLFPAHPENVATPLVALSGLVVQVKVPELTVSLTEYVDPVPV